MYIIKVVTDMEMGSREFVTKFLNDWYNHDNKLIRPEMYGMGEPIRYKLQERGIDAAIEAWLKNKMPVLLKRKSNPKFQVDLNWRENKGKDPRLFPWDCFINLSLKAEDNNANELFRFIVSCLNPAFGLLTTEKDYDSKHFTKYEIKIGRAVCLTEGYIGTDTGGKSLPGDVSSTLPGIYWNTYFSDWSIKKLGRHKFANLEVYDISEYRNGLYVTLYEKSMTIGSQEANDIETNAIEKLGKDKFFDISLLNHDDLR